MTDMIERVARAIAKENGDDFDNCPASKSEWNANRGQFGGRFRDINEPRQTDYLDMARAAIEAMRDIPDHVLEAVGAIDNYDCESRTADSDHRKWWASVIDAARQEPTD